MILAVCVTQMIGWGRGEKREIRHSGYVFDRKTPVDAETLRIYKDPDAFDAKNAGNYFKKGSVNSFTLKYFSFLDDAFKDSKKTDELFDRVRAFLNTVMAPADAERFLAEYRIYTRYQQDVYEKTMSWGTPVTAEEAIDYLHRLQGYRREVFGTAKADILFGPSVKLEEYPIRRGMIIDDETLYGAEKEKKLSSLNAEMWGDDGYAVESTAEPLDQYNEKLKIYRRDLDEMGSDEERNVAIRSFREQLFTPDQLKRLDAVDRSVFDEKKKEEVYIVQENRINNDNSLDGNGKKQKIWELQNRMFGDEADSFRRRLVVEKGDISAAE